MKRKQTLGSLLLAFRAAEDRVRNAQSTGKTKDLENLRTEVRVILSQIEVVRPTLNWLHSKQQEYAVDGPTTAPIKKKGKASASSLKGRKKKLRAAIADFWARIVSSHEGDVQSVGHASDDTRKQYRNTNLTAQPDKLARLTERRRARRPEHSGVHGLVNGGLPSLGKRR